MRVVMFVSGGNLAAFPLQAMAQAHDVCAVVRPARSWVKRWGRRAYEMVGVRPRDPAAAWLRSSGTPVLYARSGRDEQVAEALRRYAPDLICISTFPFLLRDSLLHAGRLDAINVHPSLLPRHRGPAPLFWTYHANDQHTGVTIHLARHQADAGPILAQERIVVERGHPIDRLHTALSQAAGRLVVQAVDALADGSAHFTEQDEASATQAPRVQAGQRMVDFDTWDVERVWHFLHGLVPRFVEPLSCVGRPVRYHRIGLFTRQEEPGVPGAVTRIEGNRFALHCRGGSVELVT